MPLKTIESHVLRARLELRTELKDNLEALTDVRRVLGKCPLPEDVSVWINGRSVQIYCQNKEQLNQVFDALPFRGMTKRVEPNEIVFAASLASPEGRECWKRVNVYIRLTNNTACEIETYEEVVKKTRVVNCKPVMAKA